MHAHYDGLSSGMQATAATTNWAVSLLPQVAGVIVNFCGCLFFFSAREHGFEVGWSSDEGCCVCHAPRWPGSASDHRGVGVDQAGRAVQLRPPTVGSSPIQIVPRKVLHSSTLLPQGSWVSRYNPFIARYSVDGSTPLTSEEAEGIPAATLWLASVYWASTTILTGVDA